VAVDRRGGGGGRQVPRRDVLVGLVSWGMECADPDFPGTLTTASPALSCYCKMSWRAIEHSSHHASKTHSLLLRIVRGECSR
jgi:hypothetical protein